MGKRDCLVVGTVQIHKAHRTAGRVWELEAVSNQSVVCETEEAVCVQTLEREIWNVSYPKERGLYLGN